MLLRKLKRCGDYLGSVLEVAKTHANLNNPLEVVLHNNKKVLLGRNNYYDDIYNVIEKLYTDKRNINYLNFDGVLLLKPLKEGQAVFVFELMDILGPHLVKNKELLNAFCRSSEGPYENDNVKVNNGDTVIDCGANMGIFSTFAASKGADVFAFEPMPPMIEEYLSFNARKYPNIKIVNKALSDKNEEIKMSVSLENLGASSGVFKRKGGVEITVDATSIDEFVKDNKIKRVDFIKSDIEGMERHMLTGATETLREFAPKLAISQYHLEDDPKVLREIILDANPNYILEDSRCKIFGHVK